MNCRILFDQALLKSRELLLPTLFPNSYPKDRILIQNYVAVIILLHSITLHIPFKRVGSPLLILCSGSMTITNLKEIIRTKFLLSNQPFIITTDEICNLFGKFSSDGVDNDEVFMTAMLCIFASLLLGYDVILRGESDHTCNLIDKIQQIKTLYPNLRTVLIQANKPGLLNRSFLQERFHGTMDIAVTVDYDVNNTPHLQEMTWYPAASSDCLCHSFSAHCIAALDRSIFRGLLNCSKEEPPFRCPSVSTIPLESAGMSPFSNTLTFPSFPSSNEEQVRGTEDTGTEAEDSEELVRGYVRSARNTLAEIGRRIDSITLDTEITPFRAEWNDQVDHDEDFVRYRIIRDEYSDDDDDDDDDELGHENIHTREFPRDTNAPLLTGRRGGHKFSAVRIKTENFASKESILITENQTSSLRRKCQSCNLDGYPICTNLY